jgi:tetratricopeptide (TPR) repeat protein
MKKNSKLLVLGLVLMAFVISHQVQAQQLKLPQASPAIKVVGTIGLAKVAVKYNSPRVKGRQIWGKLVPYGLKKFGFGTGNPAPWRAGANENTVIWFSSDVKVEGKGLKAGSYGLHMIPSEKDWVIIFSKNHTSWGSYFYDESEDALRVTVTPKKAEHREWLTYGFDGFTPNSAFVYMHWEKLKVQFKVEVDTDAHVIESITNQLRNTAGFSWQGYNGAAVYCLRANKNLDKGLKWIKQSIKMNENATNRNLLGYLLMANKQTGETIKVFRENVRKYPKNWNVYDSLGENLAKTGNKKEGIKFFKKALKMAPANQKKRIEKVLKKLTGK